MQRTTGRRPIRARVLLVAMSVVGSTVAVIACTDDETAPPGATPDAATVNVDGSNNTDTSTGNGDTGTNPIVDSGPEEVDGGGVLPEDDGGTTDLDGGFDAGPACQTVTVGPYNPSACTGASLYGGGNLTTTVYELQKVNVIGSKAFCAPAGGYTELQHRGGLRVTATSNGTASFEFVNQYRKAPIGPGPTPIFPTTIRYDVEVAASGTTLVYTPTACAAAKTVPTKVSYHVSTVPGTPKKTITLRLPYGTGGNANYLFVEP